MSVSEFSTQQVLELACAAQRVNGAYLKEPESVFADDGVYLFAKQTNKMLMMCTVLPNNWTADPKDAPMPLKVLPEDVELADNIKRHYRKLMFGAIEGSNDFETNINSILTGDLIKTNQFGYVACLPMLYKRDVMQTNVKRAARDAEDGYLGEVNAWITDLDCEVLLVQRSKNFDAWNIDAKINNMLASWMSKVELKVGPCVIVKAKIKDLTKHWKHETPVTRLNYVKAAQ